MSEKEIRSINTEFETRSSKQDDGSLVIEGYALKFDKWSNVLGNSRYKFIESIDKRALDDVDFSDVRALVNHDWNLPIARTKSQSLELKIDDVGLRFTCKLPNTSYANDLYENIRVGNVNQCSFGFNLVEGEDDELQRADKNGVHKRFIKRIRNLHEISIVTLPAYDDTEVAVRSIEAIEQQEQRNQELELLQLHLDLIKMKQQ